LLKYMHIFKQTNNAVLYVSRQGVY